MNMSHKIEVGQCKALINQCGLLKAIHNGAAAEEYPVSSDELCIQTDKGTFLASVALCSIEDTQSEARDKGGSGATATASARDSAVDLGDRPTSRLCFRYEAPFGVVRLIYTAKEGTAFFRRHIVIEPSTPIQLLGVRFGATQFECAPTESIDYQTFWNAPTVAFLRFDTGGIFMGVENPFFTARLESGGVALAFEPSLILTAGERYESEPQFVGVYRKSGVMLSDHPPKSAHGLRPRFRNPCGYVPIDRAEIRAMQLFAASYLDRPADDFRFLLYNFFYPLPQMPKEGSVEETVHLKMLDTFGELGGDTIIFNPMHPYSKPSGAMDSYWDLGPVGSAAQRIMDHARSKGMRFGYYMGCARHGGEGNSCALPFAPEKTGWKKVDATGKTAAENCMGSDGFAEWWFTVQKNTIDRFGLGLWSWDPGPGNGSFCHSADHGHLPGKGAYKGWRNATEVMRRLKEVFPGIYFQAYYGRKEFGLWGFKYFDQYESYWEWGVGSGSHHPELSADRFNADGTRLQSWWNQNFRFHPSLLNHCMVHRFQEGVWDPRLVKAWDHFGWRYSVMSCLASGGDITTVILPENNDLVPGMKEFYGTWIDWARKTASYRKFNIPFGHQVRVGGIDGWARISDSHGYIFLCNPGPRPARVSFSLDDEIGLLAKAGRFALTELYPEPGFVRCAPARGGSGFAMGERVSFVIPAYEVVLLELAAADEKQSIGSECDLREHAGYPRCLDNWCMPDGKRFEFPLHAAADRLELKMTFEISKEVRDVLARAKPRNVAEFEPLVAQWRKDYPDTFAWARPDRLWLSIPFTDADCVKTVTLVLNGRTVPVECHTATKRIMHFADVTDFIEWGKLNSVLLTIDAVAADQFLGPYLEYPRSAAEEAAPRVSSLPVVYDMPVDADMPLRVAAASSGRAPVVTSVRMDPPYLQEGKETVFSAEVNLPQDQFEGVYISCPWNDCRMTWDEGEKRWIWKWTACGRTGLIMDVPKYTVWAVSKTGVVSNAGEVMLDWRF